MARTHPTLNSTEYWTYKVHILITSAPLPTATQYVFILTSVRVHHIYQNNFHTYLITTYSTLKHLRIHKNYSAVVRASVYLKHLECVAITLWNHVRWASDKDKRTPMLLMGSNINFISHWTMPSTHDPIFLPKAPFRFSYISSRVIYNDGPKTDRICSWRVTSYFMDLTVIPYGMNLVPVKAP